MDSVTDREQQLALLNEHEDRFVDSLYETRNGLDYSGMCLSGGEGAKRWRKKYRDIEPLNRPVHPLYARW